MTDPGANNGGVGDTVRSGPNWDDPSVAVGNAPPMPRWPLAVALLAWGAGMLFLLIMMTERFG